MRAEPFHFAHGGNAIHSGHQQIKQDHIGKQACDERDALRAIFAFANDLHIRLLLQQESQSPSDDGMVVHQHNANHVFAPVGLSGSGSCGRDTNTRVPCPGALSRAKEPPSSCTRSRIERSPSPCCVSSVPGSKPCPLSVMVSVADRSWGVRSSVMMVASAWRAALESASCEMRKSACSA